MGTRGIQECPFSKDSRVNSTLCGKASLQITISNLTTHKTLMNVTEMSVHLIRDHHFFEGNTPYRIDPETIIDVLGIEPGVDYKVKTPLLEKGDHLEEG